MQQRKLVTLSLLLVLGLLTLAACGGGGNGEGNGEAEAPGDAQAGQELYQMTTIGDTGAPGCVTCHSVEPTDDPLQPSPVGPSHYGLADRAGEYEEGTSAEAYLRESIVNPNAHIVEGFAENVMYQNYAEDLSEEQIDNIVAYLLTLQAE